MTSIHTHTHIHIHIHIHIHTLLPRNESRNALSQLQSGGKWLLLLEEGGYFDSTFPSSSSSLPPPLQISLLPPLPKTGIILPFRIPQTNNKKRERGGGRETQLLGDRTWRRMLCFLPPPLDCFQCCCVLSIPSLVSTGSVRSNPTKWRQIFRGGGETVGEKLLFGCPSFPNSPIFGWVIFFVCSWQLPLERVRL